MRKPFHWAVGLLLLAGGAALLVINRERGQLPSTEPTLPAIRFTDVTAAAGLRFRHFNGAAGKKLLPETMGSGVAVLDYDRDGRPDLFFVNSRPWPGQPNPTNGRSTQALYRNKGDSTFEDMTATVGLDVSLYGMGVAVGDFDNDGWPDLFITAVGGDHLLRNAEGKRFEDVTARAGVGGPGLPSVVGEAFWKWSEPISFPSSATWLDYDLDGKLDLFVCRYLTWSPAADLGVRAELPGGVRAYVPPTQFRGADNVLYHNRGDGTFEDVSATTGILVRDTIARDEPVGKALGVVACDPDRDGWPDLVVACDMERNLFFHNVAGTDGKRRYEETAQSIGIATADGRPRGGMGIDAAYLASDQFTVLIANFTNEPNSLFRLGRTDPLLFSDSALTAGLAAPSRPSMKFGAIFFDFDLDGRPDLLTCNGHLEPDITASQPGQTYPQPPQLFWNAGWPDRPFIAARSEQPRNDLFLPIVGRCCAVLDFNADGGLDVVLTENNGPARLFRNESFNGQRMVRLVLEGDGKTANRDALGAEVTIETGGVVQRQYVAGARGYLSQSEATITFGVGTADVVDRVTVRWPQAGGRTQEWRGLKTSGTHKLVMGQ